MVLTACLLTFVIWSADTACAQSAGTAIALFDGHSTSGWAKANGQPHEGWVVEDGALYRKSGGGDLYHEGMWRDFVLYFQWKISKAGNSGLKYRVRKYGNANLGCEYQILDDQNAKERNKAASLYDVYEPAPHKPIIQPDVWHFGKIVVCGDRIEHWLNGVLVVQANVGGQEWNERIAKSKFRDRKGFGANREGRIFLQDHGNPVWFRQIVLVPLDCDQHIANSQPNTIVYPCESPVVSTKHFNGQTSCCRSCRRSCCRGCCNGGRRRSQSFVRPVGCPTPHTFFLRYR